MPVKVRRKKVRQGGGATGRLRRTLHAGTVSMENKPRLSGSGEKRRGGVLQAEELLHA